jgi:hypothetical protein
VDRGPVSLSQELDLIKDFEVPPLDRADIMRKHGRKYARLFMILLSRLKKTEDLRYTATLVNDTLQEGRLHFSQHFS